MNSCHINKPCSVFFFLCCLLAGYMLLLGMGNPRVPVNRMGTGMGKALYPSRAWIWVGNTQRVCARCHLEFWYPTFTMLVDLTSFTCLILGHY
uniref:Uncharacterized protein n=1 Tax=Arundo donax TaxID=35708 RepID=A0A0A9FY04_ARUDO